MDRSEKVKTAGIIIIGNEILSGRVHDSNSYYLASELRSLGVVVQRIVIIPDNREIIGRETGWFSKNFDYVFTSGGVGPTHDDVTMEGIALGLGVSLMRHPEIEGFFHSRYGDSLSDAVLKMAEVPEGSSVIWLTGMRYPLISCRNIYIFPGIPEFLREKFTFVKERFRTAAFYLRRILLNANETDIADVLNRTAERNREVEFGSYPVLGNPEYRIIITAESKSENTLKKAVQELLEHLKEETVVRVE